MAKIKLVTFDITNTLLRFRKPPGQFYKEVAKDYGVSISTNHATSCFKKSYKHMSKKYPNFGKGSIGWENWWKSTVKMTFHDYNVKLSTVESIATDLIHRYKGKDGWVLSEGSEELLNFIESSGAVVGVISNFDPRLNEILKNLNIVDKFRFILNSYDIDCMKPERGIFLKALEESKICNITNKESLHIGDDFINDFKGAQCSGWQSILITNDINKVPKEDSVDADGNQIFSSLLELYKYFVKNKHIFVRNET